MSVNISFRQITDVEFKSMNKAFDEYGLEFSNPPETAERFTFVATVDNKFVGCSSGLAYKTVSGYNKYFFLSDLLVTKKYRKLGYGRKLLESLENKVKELGIKHIWTWTAGYEGPGFYEKCGYKVFATFKNWYESGDDRIGFIKVL